jgi:hypothetical protein
MIDLDIYFMNIDRYSYDIRNLITSLLKRNARDRPSIDSILR